MLCEILSNPRFEENPPNGQTYLIERPHTSNDCQKRVIMYENTIQEDIYCELTPRTPTLSPLSARYRPNYQPSSGERERMVPNIAIHRIVKFIFLHSIGKLEFSPGWQRKTMCAKFSNFQISWYWYSRCQSFLSSRPISRVKKLLPPVYQSVYWTISCPNYERCLDRKNNTFTFDTRIAIYNWQVKKYIFLKTLHDFLLANISYFESSIFLTFAVFRSLIMNLNGFFHTLRVSGASNFGWLTNVMCRLERRSDVLFINISHFERSNYLHVMFLGAISSPKKAGYKKTATLANHFRYFILFEFLRTDH